MEKHIQTKIIKYLNESGCYVVKIMRSSANGVPDIIFCKEGRFYAVEVKATGKKKNTTKLQDMNLEKIIASGGKAIVADRLSDVITMLEG